MKVVALNGSPRKEGNTSILINRVFKELEKESIETELINIGGKPVRGCIACMKCWEKKDGHCAVKNDSLNEWLDKMREADGILLGSPVYCADLSGQMKSFMDRASMTACANDDMFRLKAGASVVAVRRAGAVHTFHSLNNFFTILQMVQIGSSYWNMGFGLGEGEVSKDVEGLNTMDNLGKNMAWVMKSLNKAGIEKPAPSIMEEYSSNV
ncbi:flavodoxin family protein [Maridesulfovibrio sp.]|uniref:flavodoxin family protein n=1 Tax=Maridesulfovibrio sp. TaxID=2795000 RepID=UPI003BACEC61